MTELHKSPHLLIVDDDEKLALLLEQFLKKNQFLITKAYNAKQAEEALDFFKFDLLILDIMMPGKSGIELLSIIRPKNTLPVLMLSARGTVEDRIVGLETGADDYLSKPFSPDELLLRLRSLLRRTPDLDPTSFKIGNLFFNKEKNLLFDQNHKTIPLTTVELQLLNFFVLHTGKPLTREMLCSAININPDTRTIDVQITRLRKKIEMHPKHPTFIQTIRNTGYIFIP